MAKPTALIVGATGLVGKELVHHLLAQDYYEKVKVLVRKKMDISNDRLQQVIVPDFDKLEDNTAELQAEDYYCTLGTTIKKVGTKAGFEKVDYTYPVKVAQIAKQFPEFRQYLVVTAAGSNASSPLFYNKVKGRLEEELKQMQLPALKIFRPSLLLGDRDEVRLGEQAAKAVTKFLSFFMVGSKRALLAIHGSEVAKAMAAVAQQQKPGTHTFNSKDIYKLAKSTDK